MDRLDRHFGDLDQEDIDAAYERQLENQQRDRLTDLGAYDDLVRYFDQGPRP
jgi:hypothetical protein